MPQSEWAVVWLAIAAVSLAVMALMQVGAIIALLKVAREGLETVRGVQKQIAPLVDRGQVLIASTTGVVEQAQGVMSRVSAQIERAEDAASAASEKVADFRRSVRPVTANVAGTVAGVRAFWAGLQGQDRDASRDGSPDLESTTRFDAGAAPSSATVR